MDSKIINFYFELSNKKYYKRFSEILENSIEDCYKNKDTTFIALLKEKYNKNDIVMIVNRWIDRYNKDNHKKWFSLYDKDILRISTDTNIVKYFYKFNKEIISHIEDLPKEELESYIYLYCGFSLYFEDFSNNVIIKQQELNKIYNRILKNKNYLKWNLIPISKDMEFVEDRIFDKKNNKTIHICLRKELLNLFHEMIDDESIRDICLRSNDIIEDGLIPYNVLIEGVEKGQFFDLKVASLCAETKLYSNMNYNNQLWIFKDANSITFEEMLDDFQCGDENSIVTQMIHLEFFEENGISFISHLDKENIFYTIDEYSMRCRSNIKGTAKKRVKFFKIDNSRIRFDYPCKVVNFSLKKKIEEIEIPFIYFIVRFFFDNTEIIDEYFSKLNKLNDE